MRRGVVLAAALVLLGGCSSTVRGTAVAIGGGGSAAPSLGGAPVPGTTAMSVPPVGPTSGGGTASTGGVPSWVKPGLRITWYQGAASVAQSSYSWVEDPNGAYVDAKTGTHYRRTDESGEGQGAGGGDGISQLDILGVQGSSITYQNILYGLDHATQTWTLGSSQSGTTSQPPTGAWVDPATLAQLSQTAAGGILVLTGPYPVNGTTFNSVSVVNSDPTAYSSTTYDLATGLLLAATTSTAGAAQTVAAPGQNAPQGNTELTVTRLVGTRQMTLPGLGGSNPAWTTNGETLAYSGTWSFANPVDPSTAAMSAQATMSVQVAPVSGTGWANFSSKIDVQSSVAAGSSATGVTGPTGLYWIDPAALAGLQTGATLDTDPVTGQVEAVKSADGSSVVIDSELKGISTLLQYDRQSGKLVALSQTMSSSGQNYQFQLQG